jgi:hypothetical protein
LKLSGGYPPLFKERAICVIYKPRKVLETRSEPIEELNRRERLLGSLSLRERF